MYLDPTMHNDMIDELYIHNKEMFHGLTRESPNQSPYPLHRWEIDTVDRRQIPPARGIVRWLLRICTLL